MTVNDPVLVSWEAVDVDNEEAGGFTAVPDGTTGRVVSNNRNASPNIRILLSSADFGEVTTWASVTSAGQTARFWVGNSGDGSLVEEIELNEGVDTSFVLVGNRLRNNLFNKAGLGGSSGTLPLQTNGNVGETYYVYLAIDDGRDGRVADAVTGTGPQQTNFGGYSPLVRAPGTITFTGTVPTNPPTATRFLLPVRLDATIGEPIKLPIVPDVSPAGKQINVVDLFMTVDANLFEAIDQDATKAGVQPFSLGENSAISSANVQQNALVQGDNLLLDFIYTDVVNGLTFFDGEQSLAIVNLRPKFIEESSTVTTAISLDNSGNRVSKMLDATNTNANAFVPQPTVVNVNRRSTLSGKVPLQGRTNSAALVTFMLREVGSYASIADSLFILNDVDPDQFGVQIQTTDVDGKFVLQNVPSGRYVLTASVQRHLTGHDTVLVKPGLDITDLLPTRDGDKVQHTALLAGDVAGDVAGFVDSTGASVPDNAVTSDDVNAVNDAIFSQPEDANYNTFADLNQDGIVNATDKDFTTANITDNTGASGSIRPVFPSFKQALPEGDNTGATVTLSGYPQDVVRAGEMFDVTVEVHGARAVRTYEVHLAFDTTKVVVAKVISRGSLLENYLTDMVTRVEDGEVAMVNSILGHTPVGASGDGTLATVRFRAIGRATESQLVLGDVLLIDVDHLGAKPRVEGEITIVVSKDAIVYHDKEGGESRGLILADVDAQVDFNDFLVLVKSFTTEVGESDFDRRADLNADDRVDFADFVIFSSDFGKVAVDAPTSGRASKSVPSTGANSRTGMYLQPDTDGTVALTLSEAVDVQGWQATVVYDPTRYDFVDAQMKDLLTRSGATVPLMLVHREGPGRITLASAVGQGKTASGSGVLAELHFRPRSEAGRAEFDLAEGRVFDSAFGVNDVLPASEEPSRLMSPISLLYQRVFKPLWSSAVSP